MYFRMPAWQFVLFIGFIFLGLGIMAGVILAVILGGLILFSVPFLAAWEEDLQKQDQKKREEEKKVIRKNDKKDLK